MILDIMDFWTKEWPLIANAPVLAIGGAIVIAVAAAGFSWFIKNAIDDGELRANRERLELAKDRQADAEDKLQRLEVQIADLHEAITKKADIETLNEHTLKVETALEVAKEANDAVHYVLSAETGKYMFGS